MTWIRLRLNSSPVKACDWGDGSLMTSPVLRLWSIQSCRVLKTMGNLEMSRNLLILENSSKSQGISNFLREICDGVINGDCVCCLSTLLKATLTLYDIRPISWTSSWQHIVSDSCIIWLGDTVTSYHAPWIKCSVIVQESCRTDC